MNRYISKMNVSAKSPVVGWWSGGVTSAMACKLCVQWFGAENVRLLFIDTRNEDDDTFRFKAECEQWYGLSIETLSNPCYSSILDVWYRHLSLNVATGAKCSQMLKRVVREKFERENPFAAQAFGFDIDEVVRAKSMLLNNANSRPIFPLISSLLTKKNCIDLIASGQMGAGGVRLPDAYYGGYGNNNCWKTGCVQGGIGYWQKIRLEFPEKFDAMAQVEHDLTNMKGHPVTMLKDQGKHPGLVFLKPHPGYPGVKDIGQMKGVPPKPLIDCNGFCGSNDLLPQDTSAEINYQDA